MNLPPAFVEFQEKHPEVHAAYEAFGKALAERGPLDAKTRALAKIGIATGAQLEGAVRAHVRRALAAGCSPAEIRHVTLLSATTIGFPSMMAARTWADDELSKE